MTALDLADFWEAFVVVFYRMALSKSCSLCCVKCV